MAPNQCATPLLLLRPTSSPTLCLRRPTASQQQIRQASLLRRPKRPYTFTQLLTLSDGSTFTHRTTSPIPIYRSTKDTRNAPLWNPSSQKLLNVEEDEAGRLRAFRTRFGRGWDAAESGGEGSEEVEADEREVEAEEESMLDLISSFGREAEGGKKGKGKGRAKGEES